MEKRISKNIFQLFTLFTISFIFLTVFIQSSLMIISDSVFQHVVYFAFVLSILSVFCYAKSIKKSIFFVISSILLYYIAYNLSFLYLDLSYDGLFYHQYTINSVKNGINVFQSSTGAFWGDAYPKAIEIFAGSILLIAPYKMSATAFLHILLATAAFAYTLYLGWVLAYNKLITIIVGLLCATPPLFFQQLYTTYVDLALYFFAVLQFVAMLIFCHRKENLADYFIFIMCGSIAISIKMSGILYPFVACLILLLYNFYSKTKLLENAKQLTMLSAPLLFIGVLVFGYNPYVTNIIAGKHIFHPLSGEEKIEFMNSNSPLNFRGESNFHNFFTSITSRTTNNFWEETEPKINIFRVNSSERHASATYDVRVAGWGPLFLASLLFSFALFFLCTFHKKTLLLTYSFIVLSTVIHPESWWARYAQQVYLMPVFTIFSIAGFRFCGKYVQVFTKTLVIAIVAILYINLIIIFLQFSSGRDYYLHSYSSIAQRANNGEIHICTQIEDSNALSTEQLLHYFDVNENIIDTKYCNQKPRQQVVPYMEYVNAQ